MMRSRATQEYSPSKRVPHRGVGGGGGGGTDIAVLLIKP